MSMSGCWLAVGCSFWNEFSDPLAALGAGVQMVASFLGKTQGPREARQRVKRKNSPLFISIHSIYMGSISSSGHWGHLLAITPFLAIFPLPSCFLPSFSSSASTSSSFSQNPTAFNLPAICCMLFLLLMLLPLLLLL